MKIKTIFLIAYFCTISVAFADDNWGPGQLNTCGSNDIAGGEACIGESARSNCATWTMNSRQYTDEFAVLMMVAREINDHGAKFCPTQVEGHNENKGNAWTEYSDASRGNDTLCVWLCQSGWGGNQCSQAVSGLNACDISLLKRENYADVKRVASGANIENALPRFEKDVYSSKCQKHKKEEHNMILAISRWLPSGHGAYARKMVVRAERRGWKDMESTATVYPATGSSDILVCKNGYQANPAGDDCIEVNSAACARQMVCDGWTGYDESKHTLLQQPGQNCFQYRCSESGKAFASDASRGTCVDCVADLHTGVSPATGTCVRCATGQVFSESATASGFCGDAVALSKIDLQYGLGRTRNSNVDIEKQCWTIAESAAYQQCVIGDQTTSGRSDN